MGWMGWGWNERVTDPSVGSFSNRARVRGCEGARMCRFVGVQRVQRSVRDVAAVPADCCSCARARTRGLANKRYLSYGARASLSPDMEAQAGTQGSFFLPSLFLPLLPTNMAIDRDAKSKATGRGGANGSSSGTRFLQLDSSIGGQMGWEGVVGGWRNGSVWVGSALLKREKGSVLVIKRSTRSSC